MLEGAAFLIHELTQLFVSLLDLRGGFGYVLWVNGCCELAGGGVFGVIFVGFDLGSDGITGLGEDEFGLCSVGLGLALAHLKFIIQ